MAPEPTDDRMRWLENLYYSGELSDLIVKCGEKIFKMHRIVVLKQTNLEEIVKHGTHRIVLNNEDPRHSITGARPRGARKARRRG
jgi:hypothetical protein